MAERPKWIRKPTTITFRRVVLVTGMPVPLLLLGVLEARGRDAALQTVGAALQIAALLVVAIEASKRVLIASDSVGLLPEQSATTNVVGMSLDQRVEDLERRVVNLEQDMAVEATKMRSEMKRAIEDLETRVSQRSWFEKQEVARRVFVATLLGIAGIVVAWLPVVLPAEVR